MWNSLVELSTWTEINSGQIQIIIALFALYLAFKGYEKILRQIEISQEQEHVANEQRYFELYTKIISEFGQTHYLAKHTITKYKDIIADYKLFLRELIKYNNNDTLKSRVNKWIRALEEQELKVKNMEMEIKDLFEEFKEHESSDVDSIQIVLKRLIPLTSHLNSVGETPDRMRINLRKLKAQIP